MVCAGEIWTALNSQVAYWSSSWNGWIASSFVGVHMFHLAFFMIWYESFTCLSLLHPVCECFVCRHRQEDVQDAKDDSCPFRHPFLEQLHQGRWAFSSLVWVAEMGNTCMTPVMSDLSSSCHLRERLEVGCTHCAHLSDNDTGFSDSQMFFSPGSYTDVIEWHRDQVTLILQDITPFALFLEVYIDFYFVNITQKTFSQASNSNHHN